MTHRTLSIITAAALAAPALANPVDGVYQDGPGCDNHGNLAAYEELGLAPMFPMDELIDASATLTTMTACPVTDDGTMPNALVVMTNLSGQDWDNLFYVADPETRFSNVDGFATTDPVPNAASIFTEAFRIDAVGMNRPLIAESILADGIFQAGETWEFIVQDFGNLLGFGAADLSSLDFGSGSSTNFSAASIVAFQPIPAPGAAALFGLAGLTAAKRRRVA